MIKGKNEREIENEKDLIQLNAQRRCGRGGGQTCAPSRYKSLKPHQPDPCRACQSRNSRAQDKRHFHCN